MCAHVYHCMSVCAHAHKLYVCVLKHMKNINYIHTFCLFLKVTLLI